MSRELEPENRDKRRQAQENLDELQRVLAQIKAQEPPETEPAPPSDSEPVSAPAENAAPSDGEPVSAREEDAAPSDGEPAGAQVEHTAPSDEEPAGAPAEDAAPSDEESAEQPDAQAEDEQRQREALEYVREEVKKAAKNCAEILDAQKRRFFPFHAFKRNIKKFMASKFPSADWKCTPPKARIGKVSFRVKECLYYKISKKFGCPELCFIFCEYEEEAFKGLAPAIGSRREGALATGHEACAFTFFKGRKA